MSEDITTLTAPATSDHESHTGAVRTYRGRKLEDILPQIREELGADAIILREREGLVGGFGGFFAQRFVEVEARAGGPLIDVYDEDGEHELATSEQPIPVDPTDNFVAALRSAASAWTEDDTGFAEISERADAELRKEVDTDATDEEIDVADLDGLAPVEEPQPASKSFQTHPLDGALAELVPASEQADPPSPAPAATATVPARATTATPPATTAATPASSPPEPAIKRTRTTQRTAKAATPAPRKRTNAAVKKAVAADTVSAAGAQTPPEASGTPQVPLPVPVSAPRAAVRASARRSRPPKRLRKAITRRLGPASAGTQLDMGAAITIARDLTARGASEALANVLVSEAAAHGSVFADGHSLRAGARAQLARRITQPPLLPASGAAVAFVGAGGAGKTSCAAALASAYARSSTLPVAALSLRCPDAGRMLAELLRGDRAEVQAIAPLQAARAVADRRSDGIAILDTAAVNPSDSTAVAALSAELEPLALDAIYITLPATLGPQAARSVVASFSALGATAIAITHADETDQIGAAVEIVAMQLIALAYVHAGTDPTTALNALEPKAIAARLLP